MKLAALHIVLRTDMARTRLLKQLEALPSTLRISIDGEPQDDAMVHLVAGMVAGELRGRVRSLERDLESLGVTLP